MMQGSLAEQLRVLRARMGLSLTEAASRAGVTRDTLSDLEHGKRQPYMPTLAKIAAGYGVPVEELLEEPALAGKAEAPQETGPGSLDVSYLPGLDAAIRRRGTRRPVLAHRIGMTTGELFDYEVGEKKPSEEIIDRIADALDCNRLLLVVPPEQAEEFIAEDRQQNAVIQEKRDEWLQEMREELIRNPEARRVSGDIKEAYRASDEERKKRRGEEGQNRPA